MGNFDLFDSIIAQICDAAAAGVVHHVQGTGADPIAVARNGGVVEDDLTDAAFKSLRQAGRITQSQLWLPNIGKVDMAIYYPTYGREFGLVEFKCYANDAVATDRPKLLQAMKEFPAWRFSAVCFLHADNPAPNAHLPALKKAAADAGDTWHCVEVVLPGNVRTRYDKHYMCARSFVPQ
jgi:hypothetical protein